MQKSEPLEYGTVAEETARIQKEYMRRDAAGHVQSVYSYTNPAFLFHMQERERAVLSLLRTNRIELKDSHILEVGCGNGHILQRFLEFGIKKATGIDLMMNRIQDGKRRYPILNLIQGNAAFLPFRSDQFDMVVQFTCLSSVLDPQTKHRVAGEMCRVLKPGGTILFYDLRPLSILNRIVLRALRSPRKRVENGSRSKGSGDRPFPPTPTHPTSLAEIRRLFRCDLTDCRKVSLDFCLSEIAARSVWLARFLSLLPVLRTYYLVLMTKSSISNQEGFQ